jgi:hypothetical protein
MRQPVDASIPRAHLPLLRILHFPVVFHAQECRRAIANASISAVIQLPNRRQQY